MTAVGISLEVFEGPFDLLVTLILNEEIDLLEVHLAEVVLAYVERLEARGELDLEAATEFLVLIAALLELKSRLMLPGEEMEGLDLEPQEAVEELLARLLDYRRYRGAAEALRELLGRRAGLPLPVRAAAARAAPRGARRRRQGLRAGSARRGDPRPAAHAADGRHQPPATASPSRSSAGSRTCASCSARRRSFTFDEAVAGRGPHDAGGDAVRAARALQGRRADVAAAEPFGPIEIQAAEAAEVNPLARQAGGAAVQLLRSRSPRPSCARRSIATRPS